jgi:hypothetical protein
MTDLFEFTHKLCVFACHLASLSLSFSVVQWDDYYFPCSMLPPFAVLGIKSRALLLSYILSFA